MVRVVFGFALLIYALQCLLIIESLVLSGIQRDKLAQLLPVIIQALLSFSNSSISMKISIRFTGFQAQVRSCSLMRNSLALVLPALIDPRLSMLP
jgi:uncharacterized membrane protein YbhN (UPF0104 family)